ncbi:hypothetical protein QVO32_03205 [Bacteroides gallinaceum]|jgi:hypothetical protein|uniref:hypothetical protein n=1 Tax=Bacteroides gallinaceum TaxID=1462571 RepID=UPI0025AB31DD|nr:hypothetical protein [Bacteroides gallinaceum]MDN0078420.1 hypothetical protein [Bacteroides gallinaceum]
MKKHYKSKTAISINVVLKSKKSMHIAFTAQSDGSSVYTTDNPDVQYALEHHYKYGKLFKLVSTESEADIKAKKEAEEAAANEKKDEIRKVSVSDLAAAKDFLADTFGISRTSLRSEKAIMEAAKAHNIEFEGLEE